MRQRMRTRIIDITIGLAPICLQRDSPFRNISFVIYQNKMFANKFVRRVGATAFQGKRMMSGSSEEAMKEVKVWQKATAG